MFEESKRERKTKMEKEKKGKVRPVRWLSRYSACSASLLIQV